MNSEIELLDDLDIHKNESDDKAQALCDYKTDDTVYTGNIKIKVFGVGGGGSNAVDNMIKSNITSAEFVVINTDAQDLHKSIAPNKLQIGTKLTSGLGAGADPSIGARAAEESREKIVEQLQGVKLLFITAGMGGGTGTGAAPVIANISKELGIITIGVVTKPFNFEMPSRMNNALQGIEKLRDNVDALIVVPNAKLLQVMPKGTPMLKAFQEVDEVLKKAITGITDIIDSKALINLDFNDIKRVIQDAGMAHIGVGVGEGENRAFKAIQAAVSSPLLDTTIYGAKGLIINVTGGVDLAMDEINEACERITKVIDPSAVVIVGYRIDTNYNGKIVITLIATGFSHMTPLATQSKKEEIDNMFRAINMQREDEEAREAYVKAQTETAYNQNGQAKYDDNTYYESNRVTNTQDRYQSGAKNNSVNTMNNSVNVKNYEPPRQNNYDDEDVPEFIRRLRGNK